MWLGGSRGKRRPRNKCGVTKCNGYCDWILQPFGLLDDVGRGTL